MYNNNNAYNIKNVIFMNKNRVIKIPVHSMKKAFFSYFAVLLSILLMLGIPYIYITLINMRYQLVIIFSIIFFASIVIFCVIFFLFYSKKNGYVSDIQITVSDISITYRTKGKISNIITVPTEDIKSFFADFEIWENIFYHRGHRSSALQYNLNLLIETPAEPIPIPIDKNFCNPKSLMIKLLKYSHYIPNFSYKLSGEYVKEHPSIKEKYKRYLMGGHQKLPLYISLYKFWSELSSGTKITFILLVVIFLIVLLMIIFILFPEFYYIFLSKIDMIQRSFK